MPLVGRRINATVQRLLSRASHSLSSLPAPCYWLSGSNSQPGGVGPPPPPRLLACQVACMRGGEVIIRDVNLSIHEGGAVLLMGPNGSGKSTMLRLLAGFIRPTAGWLMWEGHNLADRGIWNQYRTGVHFLQPRDAIKDGLSVDQNVRLWARLEGTEDRVHQALTRVGLIHMAAQPASVCSLGQRRRLQLARLLAIPRPLWLLDEPSVGLDLQGVELLESLVREHREEGGMAVVATHVPIRMKEAMLLEFPKRAVGMKSAEGVGSLRL